LKEIFGYKNWKKSTKMKKIGKNPQKLKWLPFCQFCGVADIIHAELEVRSVYIQEEEHEDNWKTSL